MSTEVQKFNSPTLRISNIVCGRRNLAGTRVEYLIDPRGDEELGYEIPEKIVLKRWKLRSDSKRTFGGIRLSPNVWRSIHMALGHDYSATFKMDAEEIDFLYSVVAKELKSRRYPSMTGAKVVKLMTAIGREAFIALMKRHNDPAREGNYGTPDLLLWVEAKDSGSIYSRFVEVKKPEEPLSKDQISELSFLNDELNCKARCLRLKETKSAVHVRAA